MTETETISKTCGACKFWNELEGGKGECRVRSPQTIVFSVDEETKFQTCFPATNADDWCGEFEAR